MAVYRGLPRLIPYNLFFHNMLAGLTALLSSAVVLMNPLLDAEKVTEIVAQMTILWANSISYRIIIHLLHFIREHVFLQPQRFGDITITLL